MKNIKTSNHQSSNLTLDTQIRLLGRAVVAAQRRALLLELEWRWLRLARLRASRINPDASGESARGLAQSKTLRDQAASLQTCAAKRAFLNCALGALLLAAAATGGCTLRQAYPETQIHGFINGQPFTIQAPKDSTLIGFDASAQTNGTIHVHIDSLQAALNPTNLANAANGQAAIINATAQAVNQAFATAAAAAAK